MDLSPFAPLRPALTDDALIAIANKGLLRRANKDLAQATPTLVTATEDLTLQITDNQVVLPLSGPTQASCTCPATGVCRHVLVGCLWLRSQLDTQTESSGATQAETSPAIFQDLNYTIADLVTWAGKPLMRKAADFLTKAIDPVIEPKEPLVVSFPHVNITCRHFAATGLEGMICSCKARPICLHRVAAIQLQLQRQGISLEPDKPDAKPKLPDTPRSREEILNTTQQLLQETVSTGLLHLSETTCQRYATLAVSAQSAAFPRLSLNLRSLGDEINRILTRQATADEVRLFQQLGQTYALSTALQQPDGPSQSYLVGQSRREYHTVGSLDLSGMGAYPWQTASGYAGITLLFWEKQHQQWLTWSEARPQYHQRGFDPIRRYHQPLPWQGGLSPTQISGTQIRLTQAKRNYEGRLSGSTQTQAMVLGTTQLAPADLGTRYFEDWDALRDHLSRNVAMGLKVANPLDLWVVIAPTQWESPRFDEVSQTLLYPLLDAEDRPLYLQVKHREIDTHRLTALEKLPVPQDTIWGIVGRPYMDAGRLALFPISLLCDVAKPSKEQTKTVFVLGFPPASNPSTQEQNPKTPTANQSQPKDLETETLPVENDPTQTDQDQDTLADNSPDESQEREDLSHEESQGIHTPIYQTIDTLMEQLQSIANSGLHRLTSEQTQDLKRIRQYLKDIGIAALSATLDQFIATPQQRPALILKLNYLCLLSQQILMSP